MRLITRAYLSMLMASFLSLAFALPAHAVDGDYQLLELDGHKVKWGDRQFGVGASISYAFAGKNLRFADARNCGDLAPIEMLFGENLSESTLTREAEAAFRVWERAANVSFHEVDDVQDADIILGAQGQPRGRAFANVSYAPGPEKDVRAIEQALVCLNPEHEWKVGFDGNEEVYDIRYTLIHEIGHTIGLDHPGRSGQVMAYRYTEAFDELQPGDLRGVRQLYGLAANDVQPVHGFDTQLAGKPTDASSLSNLISQSVRSSDGDKEPGSISDLIIDHVGSITAVFVGVGEFLGIGEQDIALPWGLVAPARDADTDKPAVRDNAN